ncbi:DUF881 domain-containing protein [Bacillus cabrialesii]|uniref:DUF881 domain-containing protein n=1 Tax=Bacillus cabrialesii TaxID=2487276 RepID=UPI0009533DE1|nr:DUF881 domain-containing protein [Bacillus cabrialesii]AUZ26309.1 DUF881 domain-containing protein [Bacillus cereus]OLQ56732.1 NgoFVII family restriction endonuclease [Bacillus licheniformis]POO74695.1 DUF881 domain-containing protein [Bacillus subtilis]MDU0153400.1 DUF881 domain-containing protein [Bacillus cabrialesii]RJS57839.1 DUF881 domain-containing protein [Bacillus subtilis]
MKIKRSFISLSVLMVIFGLMIAVQFNSLQHPQVRDTRDMWDIREELTSEQKKQEKLLAEINKYDKLLNSYSQTKEMTKETALNNTLQTLKKTAGMTDITGSGIVITISPLFSESLTGEPIENPPPDLLKKLINELNSFGAEHIAINERRVVNHTVIRDINGTTKIDGYGLDDYPLTVKVLAEDPDMLYSRVKGSGLEDLFASENLALKAGKSESKLTLKAYDRPLDVQQLKPLKD